MVAATPEGARSGFQVRLDNFEGPFDLLLSLITKHQMEITEVALATVTDEYLETVMGATTEWELDGASEFLVVAATLLDLKAARLLPQGEVEDSEDLEMLEARDLLFARLLQYRAFKQAAIAFDGMMQAPQRVARDVSLEAHFAAILPELVWVATPDDVARAAANALRPRAAEAVSLTHLHNPRVSVREQATYIASTVQREGTVTFRHLVADASDLAVVVARFLALLELYREKVVAFDQVRSLGELTIRWTGGDGDVTVEVETDFDEEAQPDE